jgi:hypothetical protein
MFGVGTEEFAVIAIIAAPILITAHFVYLKILAQTHPGQ